MFFLFNNISILSGKIKKNVKEIMLSATPISSAASVDMGKFIEEYNTSNSFYGDITPICRLKVTFVIVTSSKLVYNFFFHFEKLHKLSKLVNFIL